MSTPTAPTPTTSTPSSSPVAEAVAGGDLWENPLGTDGFEFVEYTAEDTEALGRLFEAMGFTKVARHRSKNVVLYRQGDINFIVNAEPDSLAQRFAREHGPSACAMAFRVKDAGEALKHAVAQGAKEVKGTVGPMELNIPAIEGIGGSLLYLVDRYNSPSIYDIDFLPIEGADQNPVGAGLKLIDHLTHNVRKGRMDPISEFYGKIFGFRQIRYFDITGEYTGLTSRALTAPCGKIRIPINESKSEQGADKLDQIQEFIEAYKGEGIQHIALLTDDIIDTWDKLKAAGVKFMTPPPDTYYEMLEERLPGHGQPVEELKKRGILLDGKDNRYLLQIFTETAIGPIFFEIIQRKGDEGFGEGNFRALFVSMERDQIRRGVLKVAE
ncbi:4-hydroxyphenylpyruvate dioxygenase [Nitrospirillum pindoramense]|uniref:4-hydroxyphenylpyruvate dioxygenase n=1 Tax=Nitrospirillum amazonense TaxID=28077 RepID=A0A560GVY3_9PROT|nr:4-hydroxyphenylpyruvate dioxygenase [Nitrospirillum amazonense]TWB38193.1 4-hydroxyphenylpyruvate dioxygenase [Nitrospirillum amazonense]